MAYRIQVTATKGMWVGDKAYYELSARLITQRRGDAIPEGEFIVFDPGGYRKQIDGRGSASYRLSVTQHGVFKSKASLESDLDVYDEVEVVIPEKPIPNLPEEVAKDRAKLKAEIREADAKHLPTPQKLGTPKISLTGAEGRYWLKVFVSNEGGFPLSDVPVSVTAFAGGHRTMSDYFATNARGVVDKEIRILAAGTKVIVRVQNHEEEFDYLEQVPPGPMTYGQRLGLVAGGLILAAMVVWSLFSTTAP